MNKEYLTRPTGYYWVLTKDDDWIIALWLWRDLEWYICADVRCHSDDYFAEIDENKIESHKRNG